MVFLAMVLVQWSQLEVYEEKGTYQKANFPFDVFCSFDKNDCGFRSTGRFLIEGTWKWIPKEDRTSGFLKSEFKITSNQNPHIWSINFYGLSPLDKRRGPEGCISFIYQIPSKHMSLMLFKDELETASDQVYNTKNSVKIWSNPEDPIPATNRRAWSQASISVNVMKPFTLHFTSKYEDIIGLAGVVKVDDFELKYTPCENPTANGLNDRGSSIRRKFSWRAFLTTRKSSLLSSSSLPTSFSMSQARTSSQVSSPASESAYSDSS